MSEGKRPCKTKLADQGSDIQGKGHHTHACWTAAHFHDRAQELRRRLAVWQIDDRTEPVWILPFLESQEVSRWTFRPIILKGEHRPGRPEPGVQLFPSRVSKENEAKGYDGTAFRNRETYENKHLTKWLLRDFFEHLSDAGGGERAKFLRLTFDRILDAPMYCTCRPEDDGELHWVETKDREGNEGPHSIIGGHVVDPSLLDDLVIAAERLFAEGKQTPGEGGGGTSSVEPACTDSESTEPQTIQFLAAELAAAKHRSETENSTIQKMAAAMDSVALKVTQIAASGEPFKDKLAAIFALDERYRGKHPLELSRLVGCSERRVRQVLKEHPE